MCVRVCGERSRRVWVVWQPSNHNSSDVTDQGCIILVTKQVIYIIYRYASKQVVLCGVCVDVSYTVITHPAILKVDTKKAH